MSQAEVLSRYDTAFSAREERLLLDEDSWVKHGGDDYSEPAPSCEDRMVLTHRVINVISRPRKGTLKR